MIDPDHLAKIKKLCADAQFGYATVTSPVYHRDVKALLDERERLLAEAWKLQERCEALSAAASQQQNGGEIYPLAGAKANV